MSTLVPYRYRNHLTRPQTTSLLDDFFRPFFDAESCVNTFNVDVRDEGDHYTLEADMPGVKREDVNVDVNDGVLTISAVWNSEKRDEKKHGYVINERRSGRACRSFTLENVREDEISAAYNDGVLTLTMPKITETEKSPRRIEIK